MTVFWEKHFLQRATHCLGCPLLGYDECVSLHSFCRHGEQTVTAASRHQFLSLRTANFSSYLWKQDFCFVTFAPLLRRKLHDEDFCGFWRSFWGVWCFSTRICGSHQADGKGMYLVRGHEDGFAFHYALLFKICRIETPSGPFLAQGTRRIQKRALFVCILYW